MLLGKISMKLSIPKCSMRGIVKHYRGRGVVRDLSKSGRPRLMDVRDDRLAVRFLTNIQKNWQCLSCSKIVERE